MTDSNPVDSTPAEAAPAAAPSVQVGAVHPILHGTLVILENIAAQLEKGYADIADDLRAFIARVKAKL